ncbi:unnamed protein product [Rangifer tarandus platyrhynchus]|uniref:Uncharacterized protein n=2 Tax=Rangifer tarandus platyrhynchus TaxID=3082113 RepID=A0ACB0ERP3_RANTA|nr:unnamed protein product [Rangifer tarandus platyrhynchus]CAI9703032.1 unnamed protein product [Rangifer tarandus platyrhynchus]
MREPSANQSRAGGRRRRRAARQGPGSGKRSLTSPRSKQNKGGSARARAREPRRRLPPEGQGARFAARVGEEGAERPGKADQKKKQKGATSGDASAPPPPLRERRRRPGREVSTARLRGPAGPRPLPARPPIPSRVTSALPTSWRPRAARLLGSAPAHRLRHRCPPGPAAELYRPAPLLAAPRAHSRAPIPHAGPAPPRASLARAPPPPPRSVGRAPHSLWTRRERARLASPRSGTRGREKAGGAGARDAGAALNVRASSSGTSRVAPLVWAGAVSVSSGSIPEFPLRRPICLWRGLAFPAPELSTRTTLFFEDDEMIRNPESGECAVTSRSFL